MLMKPGLYCTCPPGRPASVVAMPRSFLVKKPSSTRVPNYGQLETRRRQESCGSSHYTWRGAACPLVLQEGSLCPPASSEAAHLRNRSSVIACLTPALPWNGEPKAEAGSSPLAGPGDNPGVCWVSGTPLRDNPNNLNLPSAFGSPQRRTPSCGSPGEGEREKLVGEQSVAGRPLERLECLDSHKPYSAFSGLTRHREQRCKLPVTMAKKYFSCKHCDKEYASLGALKMHIRTHTLPCVCKICSKAFSRPWLLQGHIRTHTGEKPYTCSHCSRAFADRSNLRAHLQTHSDIKKYQCQTCLKTFSRMSLLLRHEEAACCAES